MLLTPKDLGSIVEHTVWQRGKVLDVAPPYAIVHFPSLADTEQGPQRKVQTNIEQLTRARSQSDPELDLIAVGLTPPSKKKAAKTAKAAKTKKEK